MNVKNKNKEIFPETGEGERAGECAQLTFYAPIYSDSPEYKDFGIKILGKIAEEERFCYYGESKQPMYLKRRGTHIACLSARTNRADDFTDFFKACEDIHLAKKITKVGGIGIWLGTAPSTNRALAGIDIDHCIKDGQITTEAAKAIILAQSYAEVSPSGQGVHILLSIPGPVEQKVSYKKEIEVYLDNGGRYFTLTLQHISEIKLDGQSYSIPAEIREISYQEFIQLKDSIIALFGEKPKQKTEIRPIPDINTELQDNAFDALRDRVEPILKKQAEENEKLARLLNGDISDYRSHSEADAALAVYICKAALVAGLTEQEAGAFCLKYFTTLPLYRPKWREKHNAQGQTYGEMTVRKALGITYNVGTIEDICLAEFYRQYEAWVPPEDCRTIYVENRETGETFSLRSMSELRGASMLTTLIMKIIKESPEIQEMIAQSIAEKKRTPYSINTIIREIAANAIRGYKFFYRYARGESGCGYFALNNKTFIKLDPRRQTFQLISRADLTTDSDFIADRLKPAEITKGELPMPDLSITTVEQKREVLQQLRELLQNLDDANFGKLMLYICGIFRFYSPRPILFISGPGGTGKTFLAQKVIRGLFEPTNSSVFIMSGDSNQRDFISMFREELMPVLDNYSGSEKSNRVAKRVSNVLAMIATGNTIKLRKLHTHNTDDLSIESFPIITSIDLEITKPDLLERILEIETQIVPDGRYKGETELIREIGKLRPALLTIICDCAAAAMYYERHPEQDMYREKMLQLRQKIERYVRYLDYVMFAARALAEVYSIEEVEQMVLNLAQDQQDVLDSATDDVPVMEFAKIFRQYLLYKAQKTMSDRFKMTNKELFDELLDYALHLPEFKGYDYNTAEKMLYEQGFPMNTVSLSKRINNLMTNAEIRKQFFVQRYKSNCVRGWIIMIKEQSP